MSIWDKIQELMKTTEVNTSVDTEVYVHKHDASKYASEDTEVCVLVLPCGRSAHTEAGWFAGKGKKVIAFVPTKQEPELMYKLFDGIACDFIELLALLKDCLFFYKYNGKEYQDNSW